MPFHDQQLQFMGQLIRMRTDFLNEFFYFLNLFDTQYFVLFFVPLLWVGFSPRWGIRFFYGLLGTGLLNTFLKKLFAWPRPTMDDPSIGLYQFPSYGFPSGAAQTSMFVGLLLIHYWKNKYARIVGITYISLICFSRLYLGVHYPTDIVGGLCFGYLFYLLFMKALGPIEAYLEKRGLLYSLVISLAIPGVFLLFPNPNLHRYDALGVGIGYFLSLNFHLYMPSPKTFWIGLCRGLFASCVALILYFSLRELSNPVCTGIIALWISLVASPVYRLFPLQRP